MSAHPGNLTCATCGIYFRTVLSYLWCALWGSFTQTIVATVNIERGVAARTSDEVSGLRFDCVLTVCSTVKLGIPLGSRQRISLDTPPSSSASTQPPLRPLASVPMRTIRPSERSAKGIRVHSNRKDSFERSECVPAYLLHLRSFFHSSGSLLHLVFSSTLISLSPSLRDSLENFCLA